MTEAQIVVGETTYGSLGDVIAEQETVASKLAALYSGFDEAEISAWHKFEPDIVRLFNRYLLLSEAIDRQNQIEKRNENIRTAWRLVRDLTKEIHS